MKTTESKPQKSGPTAVQQGISDWLADYDRAAEYQRNPRAKRQPTAEAEPVPKPPPVPTITPAQILEWVADYDAAAAALPPEPEPEPPLIYTAETPAVRHEYLPGDILSAGSTVIVKSAHGTGKSTAVRELISRHERVLIVCAGVKQARAEHRKNPGYELYLNLAPGEIVADKAIVCIDSIMRVQRDYDLIVIDECEQIAAAPLKTQLSAAKDNPQGRVHLYHHLGSLMGRAKKVVLLDADAGPLTDTLCRHAGRENPRYIVNTYQPLHNATVEFISSRGQFLQRYDDTTGTHMFCASKKNAIELHKRRKQKTTLVSGISSARNNVFINSVSSGQYFPGDLITTTALRSGVSIDEGKHGITTVFAWIKCGDKYPSLADQVQAMRRCRGVKKFLVYVESGAMKVPFPAEPDAIREGIERGVYLNQRHISLKTSTIERGVHLDPLTAELFCQHRAELNRQRNNPQEWLIERFAELGTTIEFNDTDSPLLDRIHSEKQKQATEELKTEAINQAETGAIPESLDECVTDVERDLYVAQHVLNYSEPLAREAAKQGVVRNGFVKSIQRREWETKPQAELIADDQTKLDSGDPVQRCSAKVATMTQEVIGLCSHLLDGFSTEQTDDLLRPWLIRNASDYGKLTGSRFVCPEEIKTAGFLKKTLERYGFVITSRKSNGRWVYFVDRTNELNRRAIEQLTGTNCISLYCTHFVPAQEVA